MAWVFSSQLVIPLRVFVAAIEPPPAQVPWMILGMRLSPGLASAEGGGPEGPEGPGGFGEAKGMGSTRGGGPARLGPTGGGGGPPSSSASIRFASRSMRVL
ncbi:hypothetical protein FJV41_05740 [Myxococcus llanfairpwllgwyngyllgogerychwyrndrobwllllantysiliogogogochensis]|uniref:Uncharacterized protein n=1 Tax=Myxococcus llanfairpwllgwyngyllgogerychwyrndrobwllllantysiliogogogochensis TaxID=2590453 RepID=A0A540X6W4_9BACT|nr:hypothetical protein FJV41_05740 [Myxococcus llanfairpwllgwyngyllgogerychwyrndrobwllllantysiliogogogochensis]